MARYQKNRISKPELPLADAVQHHIREIYNVKVAWNIYDAYLQREKPAVPKWRYVVNLYIVIMLK
jgi:hypothetical protein